MVERIMEIIINFPDGEQIEIDDYEDRILKDSLAIIFMQYDSVKIEGMRKLSEKLRNGKYPKTINIIYKGVD